MVNFVRDPRPNRDGPDREFEEEDSEYSNRVQEDSGIQEEIREMEEQQIE
jgi:hypothetical protein